MNIDSKLEDIEIAIDNMNDTIEESSKYLKLISREMIISNLPQHLHKDQRQMFVVCDDLSLQQRMLEFYRERVEDAKDDVSSDGYKEDVERKEKIIDQLRNEIGNLLNKGCIRV